MKTFEIEELTVRVSKSKSSFLYFILESNENLCFYSTLEESLNTAYRDVHISIPTNFVSDVRRILEQLSKKFSISFL